MHFNNWKGKEEAEHVDNSENCTESDSECLRPGLVYCKLK